jgi:hypothetical protein
VSNQFRAGLGLLILGVGCIDIAAAAPPLVSTVLEPCVQAGKGCIPLNADVRQDTLAQTICARGWAAAVRPPLSYTRGIKARLVRDRHDGSRMKDFELDHTVAIALGGDPRALANLQLQPWVGEHGAIRKDLLERRLQLLVCDGKISLSAAQLCIADWERCAAEYK